MIHISGCHPKAGNKRAVTEGMRKAGRRGSDCGEERRNARINKAGCDMDLSTIGKMRTHHSHFAALIILSHLYKETACTGR